MQFHPEWRLEILAASYPFACTPACAEAGMIPTMVRVDPSANVQLSDPKWLFPMSAGAFVKQYYVLARETLFDLLIR